MTEDGRAEDGRLGISFSMKRRRLLIYRSTLRGIGMPKNIRFLLNIKMKKIAVQACEAIDRDSFKVPPLEQGTKEQFEITSINFLNMLYKIAGWKRDCTYRLYGQAYPDNRLVEFRLDDADVIGDEDFVDPDLVGV